MTAREISTYMKVSRRTICRWAKKEGWAFTTKPGPGGPFHDYDSLKLPAFIRENIKQPEIIRDKTIDWIDWLIESPWCERMCWAVIGMAIMYFGPVCFRILTR